MNPPTSMATWNRLPLFVSKCRHLHLGAKRVRYRVPAAPAPARPCPRSRVPRTRGLAIIHGPCRLGLSMVMPAVLFVCHLCFVTSVVHPRNVSVADRHGRRERGGSLELWPPVYVPFSLRRGSVANPPPRPQGSAPETRLFILHPGCWVFRWCFQLLWSMSKSTSVSLLHWTSCQRHLAGPLCTLTATGASTD